jgi:MFS family permease
MLQQARLSIVPQKNMHKWLSSSPLVLVTCMSFCAFVIYSCMYGFRKPYTVATFNDLHFLGISYKVCLVIAQVIGYMISKFLGIRFISGMKPEKRATYIVICIGIAWSSLLLFALIPAPYNIICLFVNGLPLGMVFGLVFGFLEGRKTTEIMGAFLATSFIFASGLAKTVGKWLQLQWHVSDWWMPFMAGAFFVLPLLIAVWILQHAPTPSADDIAHRTERKPMSNQERKAFIQQFGLALMPVVFAYSVFTIVRDFVEDFANELWIETGYQNNAGIFAQTSTIIALVVLTIVGSFFLIKNNFRAFKITHYLIIFGVLLGAVSTMLFHFHFISPVWWMLMATTGLYLAYLPFNCMYFERMLSSYKINANVGFVMYIADAFGYLGTVVVLLIKEFITIDYSWVSFFSFLFYTAAISGVILIVISLNIHLKLFNYLNKIYVTK